MLPPGRSSWQAPVHNKFEGFATVATVFCVKPFLAEIRPPPALAADRPSHCGLVMTGERDDMARRIALAQFCAAPFVAPRSSRQAAINSAIRGKFRSL